MDFIPENNINGANGVHESAKDAFDNGNDTKYMSYLSKMAAMDIEFNDVTYSAPTITRKGNKLFLKYTISIINNKNQVI